MTQPEVLQRKLQRLLWLCRVLNNSELFAPLCQSTGQDARNALDLEPEFRRLLALVNAGATRQPLVTESEVQWIDFHLQAFEDIWAAVRFFEEFPAGQAAHVA